jgi:SAM-dependent methyltransferase
MNSKPRTTKHGASGPELMTVDYDQLADQYKSYRKPDPRIAERIQFHLQDAKLILNVGAGIGSYEPENRNIVAIEPSFEMISKRRSSKTILIQGIAENLPFKDNIFDCSMGILTIHHWRNVFSGLQEMLRVTKGKIILFTWIGYGNNFWLEDYIPEIIDIDIKLFPTINELKQILGNVIVETVEIPCDCTDGFMCAYWRRPEMYLNPDVRKAISTFSRIPDINERLNKLHDDIESGAWRRKHGHLLEKEFFDLGYRLIVCEK